MIQVPERLYQKVAVQIAQRIQDGEFPLASRLPTERRLAEALQVSRPTIREALIALEIQGLVEIKGGSGSYVRSTPQSVLELEGLFDMGHSAREIIETRLVFEVELAGIAAMKAGEEAITLMREAVKLGWLGFETEIVRSGSLASDADGQFHRAIAVCSQNALNTAIVRFLWKSLRSPLIRAMEDKVELQQYAELQLLDHEAILRAIEAGEPDSARHAMRRHLMRYKELLGLQQV